MVDAPPPQLAPAYAKWGNEAEPGPIAKRVGAVGMGGAYGLLRAGSNVAQLASLTQPGWGLPPPGQIEQATQSARQEYFEPYKQDYPGAFLGGRMLGELPGVIAGGGVARGAQAGIPALGRFAAWAPRTTRALTDVASVAPVAERGTEGAIQLGTAPILGGVTRGAAGWLGRRFPRLGRALGAPEETPRPAAEPATAPPAELPAADLGLPESPRVPSMDPETAAAHTKMTANLGRHNAMERKFQEGANLIRDSLPDDIYEPPSEEIAGELAPLAGKRIRDIWEALVEAESELSGKLPFGESRFKTAKQLSSEVGLPSRLDPAYGEDPELLAADIGRALMARLKKLASRQSKGGAGGGAAPPAGTPPAGPPAGPTPQEALADAIEMGPDGPVLTKDWTTVDPTTGETVVVPAGTVLTPENLAKLGQTPELTPAGAGVPRGTSPEGGEMTGPLNFSPEAQLDANVAAYREMSLEGNADPTRRADPAWMTRYNQLQDDLYNYLSAREGPEAAANALDDLAAVGEPPAGQLPESGSFVTGGGADALDVPGIRNQLSQLYPKLQQVAHRYAQAMADVARGDTDAVARASGLERVIRKDLATRGLSDDQQAAVLSYLESRGATGLEASTPVSGSSPSQPRMTPLPPTAGGEGVLTTPETSAAPGRINDSIVTSRRVFAREVEQVVSLLRKLGNVEIPNRWADLQARRLAGGDAAFAADAHRLVQHLTRALESRPIAALKRAMSEDPKAAALVERALKELKVGGRGGGRPGKGGGGGEGGTPPISVGSGQRGPTRGGGILLSPDPNPELTAASGRVFGTGQVTPDLETHAFQVGRELISEGIKTPDAWKHELNARLGGAFTPDQLDYLWTQFTTGG